MRRDLDNGERLAIAEEQLSVGKRKVETGRVRLRTLVDEERVTLHEELLRDNVEVERFPIGQRVETAPAPRWHGDLLIIPVVEERLVVEKQLFVVEELHVRRTTATVPVDVPATRRVMRAVIDRDDDPDNPWSEERNG